MRHIASVTPRLFQRLAALAIGVVFPFCSQLVATSPTNSMPVAIPIALKHGRVFVPAKISGSNLLSFLLDTGYGITTIHPELAKSLGLNRAGRMTIVGIAGEEQAATYGGVEFDLGGAIYKPRRVASLPSEAPTPRSRRDGILGAGFFRRFVVEIDPRQNLLRLHDPQTFHYTGKGEILSLQFLHDTPIIEATILTPQKAEIRDRFEVDTGCDDFLCLNPEFVAANKLIAPESNSSGTKNGVGGRERVQHGTLPQLKLGSFTVEDPSANFFT